jgi:hypothetical protein
LPPLLLLLALLLLAMLMLMALAQRVHNRVGPNDTL